MGYLLVFRLGVLVVRADPGVAETSTILVRWQAKSVHGTDQLAACPIKCLGRQQDLGLKNLGTHNGLVRGSSLGCAEDTI